MRYLHWLSKKNPFTCYVFVWNSNRNEQTAPTSSVLYIFHPNGFAIKTKLSDSIAMHSFYIERKMLKINVHRSTHTHTMRTHHSYTRTACRRLQTLHTVSILECMWRGKICYWMLFVRIDAEHFFALAECVLCCNPNRNRIFSTLGRQKAKAESRKCTHSHGTRRPVEMNNNSSELKSALKLCRMISG